jgi:hypothetical protein
MMSLGGVVQRGLGVRRGLMDLRKAVALSGGIDGRPHKVNPLILSNDRTLVVGANNFLEHV